MKLWRYDLSGNQVSLGRGDVVLDELRNAATIKKHSYLDQHRLTLEEPEGQPRFHSGIRIVVEETQQYPIDANVAPPQAPAEAPAEAEPVSAKRLSDGAGPFKRSPQEPHPSSRGMAPTVTHADPTTVTWLQQHFELENNTLPGEAKPRTAREALDRHKLVRVAKDKVLHEWNEAVPGGTSSLVAAS